MEAWDQFLRHLESELGSSIVSQWLRPLKIARFDAANLYLEAQDSFQATWFEEHIRPRLKGQFFNNNGRPVKVHLTAPQGKRAGGSENEAPRFSLSTDSLDASLTLDMFVPEANPMVYKLLKEVATLTSPFNPVYLYGPPGAGKTHLLMGVADHLKKIGKRVLYVRAEKFTEHVVQAMRLGMMQEFRKHYRDIDALIIDDIHIFSRKTATQEEFFHTFNNLHILGRLILLSANVAPTQLNEIEPRLISRFEWGISLPLKKEEPRAVLEKKASLWKIALTEELIQLLLEQFPRNPLLALQAIGLRATGKGPLTSEAAKVLLKDLLAKEQENVLTPEKIVKELASHYGIRVEDICGKSKEKEFAVPRQVAMYICRTKLKLPFQKIGEFFGRDHSTVMSSVKSVQKSLEENEKETLEAVSRL